MDWKIKKQPSVLFMAFIEIPSDQELYNKLENKYLPPPNQQSVKIGQTCRYELPCGEHHFFKPFPPNLQG